MKHGSLFSGIGGFDLAAEWIGWENVFHCEWNEFCQKILKYYWPNAETYGDIDKSDFTKWRGLIDVLSGGFPCQPYSNAGRRKGKEDNRHKWPQMLRAIREIQPSWVVGENVRGLTNWNGGLVFDEVQADLETEGYKVLPFLLPACAVNAPHRRDRIWFVAYSVSNGHGYEFGQCGQKKKTQQSEEHGKERNQVFGEWNGSDTKRIVSSGTTSDPKRIGQQRSGGAERQISSKTDRNWKASWADPNGKWPTQSPIRGRNDGLSNKLAKQCLEAYGNAIVPQVALEIFKTIEQYENAT